MMFMVLLLKHWLSLSPYATGPRRQAAKSLCMCTCCGFVLNGGGSYVDLLHSQVKKNGK